jgi:small subunit ribosomal protein S1
MSDIAWGVSGEEALQLHHKGETVKAVVLDVDVEKERISLGMKQLERGGVAKGAAGGGAGVNRGETVTVTVMEVKDGGLEVQVGDGGPHGFIKRTDLGRDRDEQRPERFQVGQKFDAQVTGFDRSKKPTFSIKALQIAEEKQAVAQYGSSDSGASLGDILGAALKEAAKTDKPDKAEPKAKKADKAAKAEEAATAEETGERAKAEAKSKKAKKAKTEGEAAPAEAAAAEAPAATETAGASEEQ